MLVGQRPQRLGGHRPRRRLHRQLAAAAGDDLAGDPEEVADVDQRLELGERLLADVGEREHRLQLGAVALAQPHEAELAGVAQVDDPADDRDLSPVRVSGSSSAAASYVARTSASVWVRSTVTGYAAPPDSSSRCRFSRRTRICSGRSSSTRFGARGWSVMAPKPRSRVRSSCVWRSIAPGRTRAGALSVASKTISRPSRVSQGWWSVNARTRRSPAAPARRWRPR